VTVELEDVDQVDRVLKGGGGTAVVSGFLLTHLTFCHCNDSIDPFFIIFNYLNLYPTSPQTLTMSANDYYGSGHGQQGGYPQQQNYGQPQGYGQQGGYPQQVCLSPARRFFTISNNISSSSILNSSTLNNPRAMATANSSLNNLNTARTPHSPATAPTLLPSRATASNSNSTTANTKTTISTAHRLTPSNTSSSPAVLNTAPPPIPRAALQDNTLPASPAPTVIAV
jgi:hypothetical protein